MIIKIVVGALLALPAQAAETGASVLAADVAAPVSLGFRYTTDLARNWSGGLERKGSWVGSVGLVADLDFQRLTGLRGADAHFEALGTHGIRSTGAIGDVQGTSGIVGPSELRLYQAFFRQRLPGGRVSALAGVHDLGTEFYVTEASAVFAHASFGMGPELAMSGAAGPSAYPMTSLGASARVALTEDFEILVGAYDGDPARWDIGGGDGVLGISEGAARFRIGGLRGRAAVGAWGYGAGRGAGGYVTFDQRVYEPVIDGAAGLSVFARVGAADGSAIDGSAAGGVAYAGLVPGRDDDVVGLGAALAASGAGRETAVELTYQARLRPWLKVQPDLQWIIDPGMDAEVDDAVAGGVRVEVAL